jgi:hypothetical protein
MRNIISGIIVLFVFTLTPSLFAKNGKTSSPKFMNPFLTPEEEMKELGIKPPVEKKVELVSLKKLRLTGIIYGEEKIAIINSGFYKEGDEIAGFKIKEIKPLSVILSWDSQEAELKLVHVLAVGETGKKEQKEKEKKKTTQGEEIEKALEE